MSPRPASKYCPWLMACLAFFCLLPPLAARARQTLHTRGAAYAALGTRIGAMPADQRIHLILGLPLRNREALTNLLDGLYDPNNPAFHQFLTTEQFTSRFGPTEQDYQAVLEFARTNGLEVTGTHSNRTLVDVAGRIRDVERVFHVNMGLYRHPSEARTYYAPSTEPAVDLDVPLLQISGLDTFNLPKPHARPVPLEESRLSTPNVGSGPGGLYFGYDFRQAYVPGTSLTGAGQVVALYELEGYTGSDITTYETQAGLPNVTVQNVPVDGFTFGPNPLDTNGVLEVCLDIEVAIAMAPGLSKVVVYGATNGYNFDNDILNRIATDNSARQISSSWGIFVNSTTEQIFQQYAAQGQSFFMAVGDNDAFAGPIIGGYDDPYITVVGGTTLTTDAKTNWQSEVVWNNNNGGITPTNVGTAGGISTNYAIPTWQKNISMTANQGSLLKRNVPDVAMVASRVYAISRGGQANSTVGTSIAAPLWAALTALANQQAALNGLAPVGFLNPALYGLGTGPNPGVAFHDITVGNNTNTVSPTKFFAVPGYDLCTGWGTPTGTNLINALVTFGNNVWVDFNYTGATQNGGYETPYRTLAQGVSAVPNGGIVVVKPGSASSGTTITKPMTINSISSGATIGQ